VDATGAVVGFALWHLTFSTWRGQPRHLARGPVRPARGPRQRPGQGAAAELARICTQRGYPRLAWWVLDWNAPAIGFYRSLGAVPQDEWTTFRLDDEALVRLATT
jgi:hypothetical protein